MLSTAEVERYRREGYLVLEGLLDDAALAPVRLATADILATAWDAVGHTDAIEVEDGHAPTAPRVRRIKQPHRRDAAYRALIRHPLLLEVLADLLGPDVRLNDSKLNIKAGGYGSPVEWHQDWAFYPQTNQDVLAVGIMLGDVGPDNAPLLVVPGSHLGPILNHHADGLFCGAIDPRDPDLDAGRAVALTGPAGSVSLHHARLVHGSALNRSDRDRQLLLYECKAADAWPLLGVADFAEHETMMLLGRSLEPRLEPVPIRLPLPRATARIGIYEMQREAPRAYFERAALR